MVTDNLWCQLRTLSQKIKPYHFCNLMKLTFCYLLQRIFLFFSLYSLSLILWKVFIKEKNNDLMDFIAVKVFFKEKNDQKQSFADVLQNSYSQKFSKFRMKTPMLESLFNKLLHRCFPEAILNNFANSTRKLDQL